MGVVEYRAAHGRELLEAGFIEALVDHAIRAALTSEQAFSIALLATDNGVLRDALTAALDAAHAFRPADRFQESKALRFSPEFILDLYRLLPTRVVLAITNSKAVSGRLGHNQ